MKGISGNWLRSIHHAMFHFLAVIIGILAVPGAAQAVCQAKYSYSFTIDTVRVVGNAAERGDALTPWIASTRGDIMECGSMGGFSHLNAYNGTLPEISRHTENGKSYSIFDVGIPGVGMIIAVEMSSRRADRIPVLAGADAGIFYNAGEHVTLDQVIWIRFIKLADTVEGRYGFPSRQVIEMVHTQRNIRWTQSHPLEVSVIDVVHIPLCHVQDTTVEMGVATLADFPRNGSASAIRRYPLDMICESGAGRVDYYLEPTAFSPVIDAAKGIIGVQGGAKGIGLQLLDAMGGPLEIGKAYPFGTSDADGLRSALFGARYIRTAASNADLLVGKADAQIRVRVSYP